MSVYVVKLQCRRLNASAGPELKASVQAAWATGAEVIALDFTEVVYIDSLGVSALIAEQRKKPAGRKILLCGLNDYVREVLEITQLVRVFDVYRDADAVLKAAG